MLGENCPAGVVPRAKTSICEHVSARSNSETGICSESPQWRNKQPHLALGVFTGVGVVHLQVQREVDVSNLGNLLLYSLEDLEVVVAEKGSIRQLLDEKWRTVYMANPPRDVFTPAEMHAA